MWAALHGVTPVLPRLGCPSPRPGPTGRGLHAEPKALERPIRAPVPSAESRSPDQWGRQTPLAKAPVQEAAPPSASSRPRPTSKVTAACRRHRGRLPRGPGATTPQTSAPLATLGLGPTPLTAEARAGRPRLCQAARAWCWRSRSSLPARDALFPAGGGQAHKSPPADGKGAPTASSQGQGSAW